MSTPRQILAAIFDMDGLLIDSEPLWDRAELDVMASLGVDISRRNELPDTLGLRIDMVVDLWYARQPWNGPSRQEVVERVIARAISLVEETRPLLPGVREAVALCKEQGLLVGLASASPLHMLEKVLTMFDLRDSFDALASAEKLPYSIHKFQQRNQCRDQCRYKNHPTQNPFQNSNASSLLIRHEFSLIKTRRFT